MKIFTALLIAFFLCLIPSTVQATSFGISPAMIDARVSHGGSSSLSFTVVGYTGTVEISVENMPVTLSQTIFNTVAGSKIVIIMKCQDSAIIGMHDGKIVFLAKSGNSVMSGVKVKCNLNVDNLSPNYADSPNRNTLVLPTSNSPENIIQSATIIPTTMTTTIQSVPEQVTTKTVTPTSVATEPITKSDSWVLGNITVDKKITLAIIGSVLLVLLIGLILNLIKRRQQY
jgi:hypothetical protein